MGETRGWALAHVHALRRRKPVAVAGNVGQWHRYRALPRAHPNDGLVDVVWGELSWSDLLVVARRATTGTHLPHPALTERRAASVEVELTRPAAWFVDDRFLARGPRARISVHPRRRRHRRLRTRGCGPGGRCPEHSTAGAGQIL